MDEVLRIFKLGVKDLQYNTQSTLSTLAYLENKEKFAELFGG